MAGVAEGLRKHSVFAIMLLEVSGGEQLLVKAQPHALAQPHAYHIPSTCFPLRLL